MKPTSATLPAENPSMHAETAHPWSGGVVQVAHTGGLYRGLLYTSSREAICKNLLDGFRHFEIDVVGLGDGNAITAHDGTENAFVDNGGKYENTSIANIKFRQPQYTIMRLEELYELASSLGIYLIIDVKNLHGQVYELLFRLASAEGLLPQVIPQAYDEATLAMVRRIGFPFYLMTLWGIGGRSAQEKIAFCEANRPEVVWMRADWATPEFEAAIRKGGATQIGVHGDMDREKCLEFMRRGIHVMNDCLFIAQTDTTTLRRQARQRIEALYWLYLGRRADESGLKHRIEAIVAGRKTISDVQTDILLSPEFQKR